MRRRTIVFAMGALLVSLDVLYLIPGARELGELGQGIEAREMLSQRLERRLRRLEASVQGLDDMDEQLAATAAYAGKSEAVEALAAELDANFTRLAPGHLRKVRYLPRQEERTGTVTMAIFEYEFQADIHGLAALLHELETFSAPLLAREFCVKAAPARERPLNVRLQLGVVSSLDDTAPQKLEGS